MKHFIMILITFISIHCGDYGYKKLDVTAYINWEKVTDKFNWGNKKYNILMAGRGKYCIVKDEKFTYVQIGMWITCEMWYDKSLFQLNDDEFISQ